MVRNAMETFRKAVDTICPGLSACLIPAAGNLAACPPVPKERYNVCGNIRDII